VTGERPAAAELEVFLDFDGTLVDPNVAIVLVSEFAEKGPELSRQVDEDLHAGRLTLRQAWELEAATLRADRIPEMVEFVRREIPLRAGAHDLLRLLERYHVPTQIISGGLDFYIAPVLEREGIRLSFLSDTAKAGPGGALQVLHPHGHATCRLCGICKAQAVRPSTAGRRSVFVGDGSTDRYAAEVADIVFARRRLVQICEERGIPFYRFEEFAPVTRQLEAWLSGHEPLPRPRSLGLTGSSCPISSELAAGPTVAAEPLAGRRRAGTA
jgi:2-hydroxy-3-keto-5-methylthiopentenyl-1-phosphate phosphatase